jgi:hypothetical protein
MKRSTGAMFRGDEDTPLGPFLGNLPSEVLRLVLGHLSPFDRALFARASGSCFRACERSGLGRAGVRRGDRSQAVKMTEMVVTPTMFEWTKREAGVDEERFYLERYRLKDFFLDFGFCRLESTVHLAAMTAAGNGDLEYLRKLPWSQKLNGYLHYILQVRAARAQKHKVRVRLAK